MHFETMILLLFSALGLIDGALFALLFRRRRFYFYALAMALLGGAAGAYFLWYAKGYDGLGLWSLYLAYGMTGFMVAEIITLFLLVPLSLLSLVKALRRAAELLGALGLLASLGIGVYGAYDGNHREVTEHHDIYVKDLPEALEGYRFAQMTDTHIGPYFHYTDLPREMARAKAEGAEAVFFTGDLIDDVRHMKETADILDEWQEAFPDGILYAWGNHEYYRGKDLIRRELLRTRVELLENESTVIRRGGAALYVAGVDYPWSRGTARSLEMQDMMDFAYRDIPEGAPSILLAHHSDFIDLGFERGAFLTLTGHTHGTQFGFFGRPIITPFRYTRGMYSDGMHQGYVSRGDASWFPFRFSCDRELAVFTLHRKTEK